MPGTAYRHAKLLPAVVLCFFLIGFFPTEAHAEGLKIWTNTNGRTIEAELVGYDYESKKVKWRLPNGTSAASPLASLDSISKWRAITETPLWDEIYRIVTASPSEFFRRMGKLIFALTIILVVVDFLSFKLAVRILAGSDRDIAAYLKSSVVVIVMLVAGAFALSPLTKGGTSAPPFASQIIAQFALMLVCAFVIKSHYGIRFGPSYLIMVIRNSLGYVLWIAVWGLARLVVFLLGDPTGNVIDPLILEPLNLI